MSDETVQATWSRDKQTGAWRVLVDARFIAEGETSSVRVTRSNGESEMVKVEEVGPVFTAKFGPLAGKEVQFCALVAKESDKGDASQAD